MVRRMVCFTKWLVQQNYVKNGSRVPTNTLQVIGRSIRLSSGITDAIAAFILAAITVSLLSLVITSKPCLQLPVVPHRTLNAWLSCEFIVCSTATLGSNSCVLCYFLISFKLQLCCTHQIFSIPNYFLNSQNLDRTLSVATLKVQRHCNQKRKIIIG